MPRGTFRINTLALPLAVSRTAKTVTANGNAKVSTTQSKFGGASAYFDGTGDYLSVASDSDFAWGTGDYTIECWVYRTVGSAYQTLIDFRTAATNVALFLGIDNFNRLYVYINGGIRITGTNTIPLNTWCHLALSRSGTSLKAFQDGAQEGTTYTDSNNYAVKPVRVGADWQAQYGFTGYIDDIRASNSARYTAGFTAPTAALVNDSNTVLLIHCDGTNDSTTFTDDTA